MRRNSNSEGLITAIGAVVEAILILSILGLGYPRLGTSELVFLIIPAVGVIVGIYKARRVANDGGSCLFLATMWLLLASNFIAFLWFVAVQGGGI